MDIRHCIQHAGRLPGEAQQIIICHLCSSSVIYAVLLYNTFKIHTYFSLTKHLHVGVNHSCIARTVATQKRVEIGADVSRGLMCSCGIYLLVFLLPVWKVLMIPVSPTSIHSNTPIPGIIKDMDIVIWVYNGGPLLFHHGNSM